MMPRRWRAGPPGFGLRLDFRAWAKSGVGLVAVAFFNVAAAAIVVRLEIFRIEPDGLGEVGNSLVVVAFRAVGTTPPEIHHGLSQVESDGLGVVGNGLVVVTLLAVGAASVVIRLGILGVKPKWPR